MTTATSILPRLLDAIQDGLTSVGGLAGVYVLSGPVDTIDRGKEYIVLGLNSPAITLPQAPGAQDLRYRKEAISIPCELRANDPRKGEPGIRASRDRAFEMFALVEGWVRANKTAGIPAVDALSIRNVHFNQGIDDDVRVGLITFDLDTNTSLIDTE